MSDLRIKVHEKLFTQAKGLRMGTRLRSLLKGIVQNDITISRADFARWKEDIARAHQEYIDEQMEHLRFAEGLIDQITRYVASGHERTTDEAKDTKHEANEETGSSNTG
jgi:hypothetical protein